MREGFHYFEVHDLLAANHTQLFQRGPGGSPADPQCRAALLLNWLGLVYQALPVCQGCPTLNTLCSALGQMVEVKTVVPRLQ